MCNPHCIIIVAFFSTFICSKHAAHYINKGNSLEDCGAACYLLEEACCAAGHKMEVTGVNRGWFRVDLIESVPCIICFNVTQCIVFYILTVKWIVTTITFANLLGDYQRLLIIQTTD